MKTVDEIVRGLFLATLITNILKTSSRFAGEPFSILASILNSFSNIESTSFSQPSTLAHFNSKALQFQNPQNLKQYTKIPTLSFDSMRPETTPDDLTRLSILMTTLKTLKIYLDVYSVNDRFNATISFFVSIQNTLASLPQDLPQQIKTEVKHLLKFISTSISNQKGNLKPLQLHAKARIPVTPKMLEPDFQETYAGKKRNKDLSDQQREEARLKHLHKQEKKGAEREIRLDAQYLARKKAAKTKEFDEDRKEKTKRVFSFLETQQRDANIVDKLKKRKKSAF